MTDVLEALRCLRKSWLKYASRPHKVVESHHVRRCEVLKSHVWFFIHELQGYAVTNCFTGDLQTQRYKKVSWGRKELGRKQVWFSVMKHASIQSPNVCGLKISQECTSPSDLTLERPTVEQFWTLLRICCHVPTWANQLQRAGVPSTQLLKAWSRRLHILYTKLEWCACALALISRERKTSLYQTWRAYSLRPRRHFGKVRLRKIILISSQWGWFL
jgi:hypothetical protein